MFVDDTRREINFKLVYLGPDADLAARYVETIHSRVAPALRADLKVLRGDGQHISAASELLVFDFAPALKEPKASGLASRLHLYTMRGTPTDGDLAFLLRGVDAVLLVLDAASAKDGASLGRLERIVSAASPTCVFIVADASRGDHDPAHTTHPSWPEHAANIATGDGVLDTVKLPTRALLEAVGNV
jgi:hypothetical protein